MTENPHIPSRPFLPRVGGRTGGGTMAPQRDPPRPSTAGKRSDPNGPGEPEVPGQKGSRAARVTPSGPRALPGPAPAPLRPSPTGQAPSAPAAGKTNRGGPAPRTAPRTARPLSLTRRRRRGPSAPARPGSRRPGRVSPAPGGRSAGGGGAGPGGAGGARARQCRLRPRSVPLSLAWLGSARLAAPAMAQAALGAAGLHFDELNKLRVLEPEVAAQTAQLREQCRAFVDSECRGPGTAQAFSRPFRLIPPES